MEVSSQLHANWVGPSAGLAVAAERERENSCPCRESNLDLPVRSLVTILTELFRLTQKFAVVGYKPVFTLFHPHVHMKWPLSGRTECKEI
jgi:hypothetical protein